MISSARHTVGFTSILFLTLVVPVICQPQQPAASGTTLEPADIIESSLPATVLLETTTASGAKTTGSGFVVDPSGIIVTNLHVVRGAVAVKISLQNGDAYERVTIRAVDELRDIAIIQVPGFNIPTVSLADSDTVRQGDSVVLLGSPLGLSGTATTGIVSAIRRLDGYRVFQTDAAASPGNSGGPVLNSDGAVVGILTFTVRQGQNLNFIVPVNYARGLMSIDDGLSLTTLAAKYPRISATGDSSTPRANAESSRTRPSAESAGTASGSLWWNRNGVPQLASEYRAGDNIAVVEQSGNRIRIHWTTSAGYVYGITTHVWDADRSGFIGGGTVKTPCGASDPRVWDAPLREEIFVVNARVISGRALMPVSVDCDQRLVLRSEWEETLWTSP